MPPHAFPLVDAGDIRRLVGTGAFERARPYARNGAVLALDWDSGAGVLRGEVQGGDVNTYQCRITLRPGRPGFHLPDEAVCSCPVHRDCKHAAAVLLTSNAKHVVEETGGASAGWGPAGGTDAAGRANAVRGIGSAGDAAGRAAASHDAAGGEAGADAAGGLARSAAGPAATWRAALGPLAEAARGASAGRVIGEGRPGDDAPAALALQFEVREKARVARGRWQRAGATTVPATVDSVGPLRITMRPVKRGTSGRWTTSGLNWSTLPHQLNRMNLDPAQLRWFSNIAALARTQPGLYFGQDPDRIILDDFPSPLLWRLLADAPSLGIELVSNRKDGRIAVASAASVGLDASYGPAATAGPSTAAGAAAGPAAEADPGAEAAAAPDLPSASAALRLRTSVQLDGADVEHTAVSPIGDHGLYMVVWQPEPLLTLAPVTTPLTDEHRRLLRGDVIEIPPDDVDEFLAEIYPSLRRAVAVTSADSSVEFPEIAPPTLVLTATFQPKHVLRLEWQWEYPRGRSSIRVSLTPQRGERVARDDDAELAALASATRALEGQAPIALPATLNDIAAAEFTEHVLPRLENADGVRVEIVGERPDYRELHETPTLRVSTVETDQNDWFDLGVIVHVEGREVPFTDLFAALSRGVPKLMLIDRTYLSLRQPIFDKLRELILEAQALGEWETGALRISRYQADFWEEFEDLAEQSEQAVRWRESVGGLLELTRADAVQTPPALPAGLDATLRPYQLDGYAWLTFLWRHALGGVLADDMGLGKTVQTLALIAAARQGFETPASPAPQPTYAGRGGPQGRLETSAPGFETPASPAPQPTYAGRGGPQGRLETRPADAPFLVVAPSSVVSNWVSEAARFTPGLAVAALTSTLAKARIPLDEAIAGADIVVTSYTLFRLDFEHYAAQQWAGLILDEAQFVKNHASRAHRCAKELDAPFKLAITGTPMENNLLELWSMFDIVAPGLFPSSRRFTEEYVKPIADAASPAKATPAAHGAELLARLRRRIRPLMLRRTKQLVAPELPEKQEQVLQIELSPKHRKLYDTVLQRERQKLLGLIDDLDRNRFIVFRSLTLLRMLSLDATLVDAEAYAGIASSKLDALFDQLEDVLAEGHRALIFSQFTSFLGKVAARLEERGVEFAYLDGSTTRRASVIKKFKEGSAPLFLISLKAGGFGLNLTEADYVFLLDPWWNPATEQQAVDRTHRIGQTSSVMVYRLVATGTIEEKVMALKEAKARLFNAVLDADAAFSAALTADDIRGLLE
ncbi:DEAD/DEAH box helicase [Microbacterium sp. STN6]|uniref:DEAD/DEAH box helicase n=1 Tax=Microbacterium sp. STN6 TaxID=2995588 RepID=UPI002260E25F|nr:DEAD/DEAH box helicase [Microbacterium sp. STN6]MCX7522560.1 DEAD/DEAH box helicase [Microbacterium sp. STN6]